MAVAWCMLNPDLEKLDTEASVSMASTNIVSIFSVPTTTNSQ